MTRPRRSFLLCAVLVAVTGVTAQRVESFADWASTRVLRLDTVEQRDDVSDLRPLLGLIGGARIVALGEPGHGIHEPLAFRNRLFRFLVAEAGFTAIAIESGFAESRRVQDFVAGGAGDAASVTRTNVTYGFGGHSENVDLVQWMRAYNGDPGGHRRLRFYGIDISLGGPRSATPTPVPLEDALAYLSGVDAAAASPLQARLRVFMQRLRVTNPEAFSEADRAAMSAAIADLVTLFERGRESLVARTSPAAFESAYRSALTARQADRVFRLMSPPAPGGIAPAAWRQMSARSDALADNVRWVLNQEGRAGKVLVFAHNTHVQNAPTEGGVWANLERPPASMGQHLRAALGDDVFILGSALGGGRGAAAAANSGTMEESLESLGVPVFALDLRSKGRLQAHPWLIERRRLRAGFTFELVSPGSAFDALLYSRASTPARAQSQP